jgi:peptide/nickel transport system substrate-binding protein
MSASARFSYSEGLVSLDKDNNWVPCLAVDWRWTDDCTIEFALRKGVTFHNGEKFDAEAVRVNWEEYKKMDRPRVVSHTKLPDATKFKAIDDYTVRFILPEPDGIVFTKFQWFFLFAPAFFKRHKFDEFNWGNLKESGPWGTGPFKFVEGNVRFGRYSDQIVLEANEDYWDRGYPKVQKVIFDNSLSRDRKEAMRFCTDEEGTVDLVTFIRPLDTLKVAESRFAKVVKSRDISLLLGWFNQRKKNSRWKSTELREALNYAINRNELLRYCAKGNAYNLGGYLPPGAYGHNPQVIPYEYDTTRAKSLIAAAGYPKGFEMKIITWEAWKLEAQIISKMLERIGLTVNLEVLSTPEFLSKVYHPNLKEPPEEQDWDLAFFFCQDWFGHAAASFLSYNLLEESDFRWIEYDSAYEKMWKKMEKTVDPKIQEKKVQELLKYVYDRAYSLPIYSPLSLYAANVEVNFVPYKFSILRLKETSVTDRHWSILDKNN